MHANQLEQVDGSLLPWLVIHSHLIGYLGCVSAIYNVIDAR